MRPERHLRKISEKPKERPKNINFTSIFIQKIQKNTLEKRETKERPKRDQRETDKRTKRGLNQNDED